MPERPFLVSSASKAERITSGLQDTVFIDVGEKVIDSNVLRDGVNVGIFTVDDERLDDIIVGRPTIPQRVIRQSIAAGTTVAVGTTVDLVLAHTRDLRADVITGVLDVIAAEPLGDLHDRLIVNHRVEATRILAKVGPGGVLPPAEEATLRQIFEAESIDIGDNQIGAAVETLRAASTFGT